ncbi:MAG: type II toxin-antitoxin system Phd/YefM family antitoxin [Ardenticatenaceae bacterium]
MYQVSVKDGAAQWNALVQAALNGEEKVVTQDEKPIMKWIVVTPRASLPVSPHIYRKAGSRKHLGIVMSDDFDEPLEDFAEYM